MRLEVKAKAHPDARIEPLPEFNTLQPNNTSGIICTGYLFSDVGQDVLYRYEEAKLKKGYV